MTWALFRLFPLCFDLLAVCPARYFSRFSAVHTVAPPNPVKVCWCPALGNRSAAESEVNLLLLCDAILQAAFEK